MGNPLVFAGLLGLCAPQGALAGRVLDPAGAPLAGVELELVRQDGRALEFLARAASDVDGRFRLETAAVEAGQPRGALRLARAGFAPGVLANVPIQAEAVELGALVLHPPVELSGHVRTFDGRPIEGAELLAVLGPEPRPSEELFTLAACARTGADGSFTCRTLPPGRVTFGVRAPGFADEVLAARLLSSERENRLELVLVSEQPVAVSVHDTAGRPLAGAHLDALAGDESAFMLSRHESLAAFWRAPLTTDETGRARLRGLRADARGALLVSAAGYEPQRVFVDGSELAVTLERELELVVETRGEGGGPGPEIALVFVKDSTRPDGFCGNCNTSRWRELAPDSPAVSVLDATRWRIAWNGPEAYVDGGAPAEVAVLTRDERFQSVAPRQDGAAFVATLHFLRTCVLEGRLLDPAGDPLEAPLTLQAAELLLPMRAGGVHGRSGPDGSFRFEGLGTSTYRLSVEAPGLRVPIWSAHLRAWEQRAPLVVQLEPSDVRAREPARLRASVTRAGVPVTGLFALLPANASATALQYPTGLVSSDAAGRCELELPPGRHRLVPALDAPREPGGYQDLLHAFLNDEGASLEVGAGEELERELVLERPAPRAR